MATFNFAQQECSVRLFFDAPPAPKHALPALPASSCCETPSSFALQPIPALGRQSSLASRTQRGTVPTDVLKRKRTSAAYRALSDSDEEGGEGKGKPAGTASRPAQAANAPTAPALSTGAAAALPPASTLGASRKGRAGSAAATASGGMLTSKPRTSVQLPPNMDSDVFVHRLPWQVTSMPYRYMTTVAGEISGPCVAAWDKEERCTAPSVRAGLCETHFVSLADPIPVHTAQALYELLVFVVLFCDRPERSNNCMLLAAGSTALDARLWHGLSPQTTSLCVCVGVKQHKDDFLGALVSAASKSGFSVLERTPGKYTLQHTLAHPVGWNLPSDAAGVPSLFLEVDDYDVTKHSLSVAVQYGPLILQCSLEGTEAEESLRPLKLAWDVVPSFGHVRAAIVAPDPERTSRHACFYQPVSWRLNALSLVSSSVPVMITDKHWAAAPAIHAHLDKVCPGKLRAFTAPKNDQLDDLCKNIFPAVLSLPSPGVDKAYLHGQEKVRERIGYVLHDDKGVAVAWAYVRCLDVDTLAFRSQPPTREYTSYMTRLASVLARVADAQSPERAHPSFRCLYVDVLVSRPGHKGAGAELLRCLYKYVAPLFCVDAKVKLVLTPLTRHLQGFYAGIDLGSGKHFDVLTGSTQQLQVWADVDPTATPPGWPRITFRYHSPSSDVPQCGALAQSHLKAVQAAGNAVECALNSFLTLPTASYETTLRLRQLCAELLVSHVKTARNLHALSSQDMPFLGEAAVPEMRGFLERQVQLMVEYLEQASTLPDIVERLFPSSKEGARKVFVEQALEAALRELGAVRL